jgi:hypothetical protein
VNEVVAFVLSAAAAADATDVTNLFQFGAVGAIAALLIIFAKGAYADVKEQRDKAVAEVTRLNDLLREAHLTALKESSTALVRATDVLKEVVDDERGRR